MMTTSPRPPEPANFPGASLNNIVFMAINSLGFLVITPFVLANLGISLYGVWTILLAFAQLAGLATFSTGSAIEKFVAQFSRPDQSEQFSSVVTFGYAFMGAVGMVVAAIIFAFRGWIGLRAIGAGYDPAAVEATLGWMALSLVPQFLTQVSRGIFLGLVRNFQAGLLDSLQNTGLWLGVLILSFTAPDLNALGVWMFSLSLGNFLMSLLLLQSVFSRHSFRPRIDRALIPAVRRQAFLTWFSSIGIMLFQNVDRILVGAILGPAAAGVYSLATSVALRINILLGQFTQVLTPLASRWSADNRLDAVAAVYQKVLRFSGLLLFVVSGLLMVWLPQILSLWISPAFSQQNAVIFQILILAYAIFSLVRPAHQVLTGLGQVDQPAVVLIISGLLTLASIGLGAARFDLAGAAAANLVYATILVLNVSLVRQFQCKPARWVVDLAAPVVLMVLEFFAARASSASIYFQAVLTLAIAAGLYGMSRWMTVPLSGWRNLYSAPAPDRAGVDA